MKYIFNLVSVTLLELSLYTDKLTLSEVFSSCETQKLTRYLSALLPVDFLPQV